MNNKLLINILLITGLFIFSGILGFFLGKETKEEKVATVEIKEKEVQKVVVDLKKPVNIRDISSIIIPKNIENKQKKIQVNYLENFLSETENREIFNRTLNIFNKSKNKESLAVWVALGNNISSSREYELFFKNSLKKLNEDPGESFNEISDQIKKLGKEDDFLRGMLNNLVHQLKVEDSKKIEFFGSELGRPLELNSVGGMAEGSTSIINSLVLLKQYSKDPQEVKDYFEQSLDKNKNISESLKLRFLQYFPGLENEI